MPSIFDFKQEHLCYSDKFLDRLKYSRPVTYWGGFHNFTEESGHRVAKAFMPNIDLVLFPNKAHDEYQHFGLGTYFTNPLAPLAAIVNALGSFLYDEIDNKSEKAEKDEPVAGLVVLYALLWIVRAPLDLIVLAIDFSKMLLTYALIAAALITASPVLIPVMLVRASRRRASHGEGFEDLPPPPHGDYIPPPTVDLGANW